MNQLKPDLAMPSPLHITSLPTIFLTQVHLHQLCRRVGPACTPLQHHQCSLTPVPSQLKWGHLSAAFMKTYGGICPLVPHRICDIEPRHCPGKAYCMSKKQIPMMSHSRGPLRYHPPKHASKSISKPCTISLVINCFCAACQGFRNFTAKKVWEAWLQGTLSWSCLANSVCESSWRWPNISCQGIWNGEKWDTNGCKCVSCRLLIFSNLDLKQVHHTKCIQVSKTVFFSLYLQTVACWWLWISRLQPGTTLVEVLWVTKHKERVKYTESMSQS